MYDDPHDHSARLLGTETDPRKLWDEIDSLRQRLELRAVENRQLLIALDTIGMCAHAQGRRFVVAVLAVPDESLRLACTSMLVADAGSDEQETAAAITAALAGELKLLAEARTIAPAAENLLEVLADLDDDGALEAAYGVTPDGEPGSESPLETALRDWRRSGYPISVAQAPQPGDGWDEPEPVPESSESGSNVVSIRPPGGKGGA
jgi:hypothetical protein